jgi:hypothetical protein
MNFNDFYWHDSVIKNIAIDRNNPGIVDTIYFDIYLTEGGTIDLIFEEVYWAKMTLNFGIVAEESILSAFVSGKDDKDLTYFYSKWKGLMDDVKLDCYVINLNSTGGEIKILSKGFRVLYK